MKKGKFLSLVLVVVFAMSLVTSVSAAEFDAAATHVCNAEHDQHEDTLVTDYADFEIIQRAARCPNCGGNMVKDTITVSEPCDCGCGGYKDVTYTTYVCYNCSW